MAVSADKEEPWVLVKSFAYKMAVERMKQQG
jgi:hypothetical protein